MKKTLIELTTDLKSLKYNSGEKPYVVKDINNPVSTNGLVREVTARVDDLSRISQMLVGAPGVKYLAHEAMLQQIGVQSRIKNSGDKPIKAVLNEIGKTVVGTTKIVASTLAQVPANGTGTHFIKGFKTGTYLQPSKKNTIISRVSSFLGNGGVEGAPYALKGAEVPGTVENSVFGKNFADRYEFEKDSKFSYEKTLDKELPNVTQTNHKETKEKVKGGMPIGFLGTSQTGSSTYLPSLNQTIYTDDYLNKVHPVPKISKKGEESTVDTILKSANMSSKELEDYIDDPDNAREIGHTAPEGKYVSRGMVRAPLPEKLKTVHTDLIKGNGQQNEFTKIPEIQVLQDFRKPISEINQKNFLWNFSNYTGPESDGKEVRVWLGDQGRKQGSIKLLATGSTETQYRNEVADRINTLNNGKVDQNRDLVALYFYNINTQKFIQFRAFIDSIDDSYNADWQGTRYVGRAEEFYTYGGFSRDINISFKIAAATSVEMKPLYEKMNQLAAMTAPQYTSAGIMQGTVVRMNVGYYITNTPGIITSVKYSLVEDAPWEIGLRDPSLADELGTSPTILQCSVSFKAIHDFAPQNESTTYFGDIGKKWKGLGDGK